MDVGIIIPAAGSGQRFGGHLPKQYCVLCGVPVIIRAIGIMRQAYPNAPIVIACDERWEDYLERLIAEHKLSGPIAVVTGGATRQESVRRSLEHPSLELVGVVAIHDAVRPLATSALAQRVVDAAISTGAAIPIVPPKDTIKLLRSDDRYVESTLPRTRIGLAQTPQAFRRDVLVEAHQEAYRDRFDGTDDASIVEYAGYPVTTVEGEERNIKITTPLDWVLAEQILSHLVEH